jgi:hypothetical protein
LGLSLALLTTQSFAQTTRAIEASAGAQAGSPTGEAPTAFDLTIDSDDGETYIAQIGGETEVCRRRDDAVETNGEERERCGQVLPGCSIWVVGAERDPEELEETAEKNLAVLQRFRYIRDQRGLAAGFELDVSACGHFANKGNFSIIPLLIPPLLVPLLPISP